MNTISSEIAQVARAALDYIDALPSDVVARLPTMPGFDRDWAENALRKEQEEAVPLMWVNEDSLPANYPYDALFPFSKVDFVRMFPVYGPPAQPVAVPDEVLLRLEHEAGHLVHHCHHIDEHSCKVNRRDLITITEACRAAMHDGGQS